LLNIINDRLEKSEYPIKSIEAFEQWISDNKLDKFISEFSAKINKFVLLSDIVGLSREDEKHATFPQNVMTDINHLSFALRLNGFITKDKQLAKKAIICKKIFELSVNIFFVDDFSCYLF